MPCFISSVSVPDGKEGRDHFFLNVEIILKKVKKDLGTKIGDEDVETGVHNKLMKVLQ